MAKYTFIYQSNMCYCCTQAVFIQISRLSYLQSMTDIRTLSRIRMTNNRDRLPTMKISKARTLQALETMEEGGKFLIQ